MKMTALRNYREQVEEALRIELADAERMVQVALEGLRRLEAEAAGDAARYLTDARAGLTAGEVVERYAELDAVASAIRRTHEVITEACVRRDQKLGEVLEASREKKKVKILDDRDALRVQRDLDRLEQRAIDEVAGRRFLAEQRQHTESGHK